MLQYQIKGNGIPIIFLHGFELDSSALIPFFEPIFKKQKNYKRIYIDLPGMGKSSHENLYDADTILSELIMLINSLKINNFLVVGQSYGGYLALALIEYFEEKIIGSFLIAPMIIGKMSDRSLPKIKNKYITYKNNEYYDSEFLNVDVIISKVKFYIYKKRVLQPLEANNNKKLKSFAKSPKYMFKEPLFKKNIATPIEICLGQYDNIVGYKDQNKIITKMPNTHILLFKDSGHNILVDETDKLLKAFQFFLKKHGPK